VKKVMNVVEVEDEGFIALIGKRVTILCLNYIYTGTLTGVNETCVLLEDPAIVYETGEWSSKTYKDVQKLPTHLYVSMNCIESFGELKG